MTDSTRPFWSPESSPTVEAGERPGAPLDGDGVFLGGLGDQGLLALLAVEGLEDLVGLLGLVVEDVAGQALLRVAGAVAVDDRAAEGRALDAVAVGAEGDVPAGQLELELARARLAEEGDVILAEPAGVVVHLLEEPLVAVLAGDAAEDLVDESPAAPW